MLPRSATLRAPVGSATARDPRAPSGSVRARASTIDARHVATGATSLRLHLHGYVSTTENGAVLVASPPSVLTTIAPLVAPRGTVARIVVPFTTVKDAAGVPLKTTAFVPEKNLPVSRTGVA